MNKSIDYDLTIMNKEDNLLRETKNNFMMAVREKGINFKRTM